MTYTGTRHRVTIAATSPSIDYEMVMAHGIADLEAEIDAFEAQFGLGDSAERRQKLDEMRAVLRDWKSETARGS